MTSLRQHTLTQTVEELPEFAPGPGGAIAVLRDGHVLESRVWGYANLERRLPFLRNTIVPVCSITKQFVCALLLDQFDDPATLDSAIGKWLPSLNTDQITTRRMCNNQSGLRDYWAQTVLCGALPEGEFRPHQAAEMIRRAKSLQFTPGTRYSYCNDNFHMLGEMIADRAGEGLGSLLKKSIFERCGMEQALLSPETSRLPGGAAGYEGDPNIGFVQAENNIYWAGDAGMCASLDDMIAWEKYIDATRGDEASLYRRISVPQSFSDGRRALYGFGLAHSERNGFEFTEHSGGLRGWSLHRLYCPQERVSIIVLLNHRNVSARSVALRLFDSVLNQETHEGMDPSPALWAGSYYDEETGLVLDITVNATRGLCVRYDGAPSELREIGKDSTASEFMQLGIAGDLLNLRLPRDNLFTTLAPIMGSPSGDIEGSYTCSELDALFTCQFAGGVLYGVFDGLLGAGSAMVMHPVGEDTWRMPCQRAMDAAPPGDWTIRVIRDSSSKKVLGVMIGCWLSRKNIFVKTG